jgi:hypothetical protein
MGRYYDGDIEGEFWFAVQSSTDADFFGVTYTEPNYVDYYFDEDNLQSVNEGLQKCLEVLGENLARFNDFFDSKDRYNDKMIRECWKEKYNLVITDNVIDEMLVWYARYQLGKEIGECIEQNGQCSFTAQL